MYGSALHARSTDGQSHRRHQWPRHRCWWKLARRARTRRDRKGERRRGREGAVGGERHRDHLRRATRMWRGQGRAQISCPVLAVLRGGKGPDQTYPWLYNEDTASVRRAVRGPRRAGWPMRERHLRRHHQHRRQPPRQVRQSLLAPAVRAEAPRDLRVFEHRPCGTAARSMCTRGARALGLRTVGPRTQRGLSPGPPPRVWGPTLRTQRAPGLSREVASPAAAHTRRRRPRRRRRRSV
mmetsp:Transcript_30486/g.76341  ORF Transcript_30486/g.76341 Transcript_30486/m.76341 type:complete len:238 (+) Transcript_30486:245-958(+)